VARKRWLHEQRYPQPKYYYLKYKAEISDTGRKEDEAAEILKHLPKDHGFCAKPSHRYETMGNWLVDLNPEAVDGDGEDDAKFTRVAKQLTSNQEFDPSECADSLAEELRQGFPKVPCSTSGSGTSSLRREVLQRVLLRGREARPRLPLPATHARLGPLGRAGGASRDAGRQQGHDPDRHVRGVPIRYQDEEDDKVRIAVSEAEINPQNIFCNPFVADEMARLWIAGYKSGNYDTTLCRIPRFKRQERRFSSGMRS
ncbi:hypothetical protein ACHAWF_016772, partial [Thalassiosira exigua]